jgi:hypothetical protein
MLEWAWCYYLANPSTVSVCLSIHVRDACKVQYFSLNSHEKHAYSRQRWKSGKNVAWQFRQLVVGQIKFPVSRSHRESVNQLSCIHRNKYVYIHTLCVCLYVWLYVDREQISVTLVIAAARGTVGCVSDLYITVCARVCWQLSCMLTKVDKQKTDTCLLLCVRLCTTWSSGCPTTKSNHFFTLTEAMKAREKCRVLGRTTRCVPNWVPCIREIQLKQLSGVLRKANKQKINMYVHTNWYVCSYVWLYEERERISVKLVTTPAQGCTCACLYPPQLNHI